MTHQRWIEVPAALIARINELYQRFPWPDFAVIEARCDQCEAGEEPP